MRFCLFAANPTGAEMKEAAEFRSPSRVEKRQDRVPAACWERGRAVRASPARLPHLGEPRGVITGLKTSLSAL